MSIIITMLITYVQVIDEIKIGNEKSGKKNKETLIY